MTDLDPALVEERAFLLGSLDDLDREVAAGDLDPVDAATLRDDYTHRLADVQRALEGSPPAPPAARPPAPPVSDEPSGRGPSGRRTTRGRWVRRVVAILLVVGIAAGSGLGVATFMGQRRPGDTVTGATPASTSAMLDQAAQLSSDGKVLEAVQAYDAVLQRQPDNVEALAERGFLLLRVSQSGSGSADLIARGRSSIELALSHAPNDPRILFYLGAARFLGGDPTGANAAFDEALNNRAPADVAAAITSFRADMAASASTTSTTTH